MTGSGEATFTSIVIDTLDVWEVRTAQVLVVRVGRHSSGKSHLNADRQPVFGLRM
jgi:hypothetical protein